MHDVLIEAMSGLWVLGATCFPSGKEVPLSSFYQKLALWLVFGLIFVFMWNYFSKVGQSIREISYSDFLERVEQGHVRAIRIEGEKITGEYVGVEGASGHFKTYIP